ncbi:hypothetical protein SCHPADRAFT_907636 [Schizopora paradoxa]|uniref:Uncharacterized protein n=1 Tax=Schizopora paradoxa TaxID=27342 RepID=A0A0H2RDI9_9AGAM|nr:hypothetical protein SCHPADRAFT_907636 [Schizopora paradoxa]
MQQWSTKSESSRFNQTSGQNFRHRLFEPESSNQSLHQHATRQTIMELWLCINHLAWYWPYWVKRSSHHCAYSAHTYQQALPAGMLVFALLVQRSKRTSPAFR